MAGLTAGQNRIAQGLRCHGNADAALAWLATGRSCFEILAKISLLTKARR
jgi:hypothetical protein